MPQPPDSPLRRLDKRSSNYPLFAGSALLVLLLLAGLILASRGTDWISATLFLAAILLFVIVLLIDLANRRRIEALDDRKFIRWDAAMPEIQRQNVNLEVRELARVLNVGEEQLSDLLSAYIVAEDLALRQIQQEENLPLMRHVSIGKAPFDGILVDQDLITCIEVAFLVSPDLRQEKIDSMLKKVTLARKDLLEMKSRLRLRLRLMVVLVTQLTLDEEQELRGKLGTTRFSDTPVDVDIRMLDFEMLQKVYVSE